MQTPPAMFHFLDAGEVGLRYVDLSDMCHLVCVPYEVRQVSLIAGLNFGVEHFPPNDVIISDGNNYQDWVNDFINPVNLLSMKVLVIKGDGPLGFIENKLENLKLAVDYDVAFVIGKSLSERDIELLRQRWGLDGLMEVELSGVLRGRRSTLIYDQSKINISSCGLRDGYWRYIIRR